MHFNRATPFAFLLVLTLLPGACAIQTPRVGPPDELLPPEFSSKGQAPLPEKWWTALGDEELSSLVDRALAGNFNLRVAWDRLDQARAVAVKSGSSLLPKLDGSAGASRTRSKTKVSSGPAGGGSVTTARTDLSLGLAAGYEVDLWGRIRSTVDAAMLDVGASQEDLRAAAITISAQVAGVWYRLIEERGQLKLLGEQIRTNEDQLELITLRFRRGMVSAADVLQQRQLVESRLGDRVLVESAIEVLEHQLAVLLGQAPGTLDIEVRDELPQLPPLPEAGLPAEWVRRRPDIRSAELRVQAADRRVAAAMADRFPRLSISARSETSAEKIQDLFDNWLSAIAANMTAPLFDGGLRQAEVDRTRAVVSERLNAYSQTVLAALQEVEDALKREVRQTEYVESLGKQLDLSQKATDQTRENYTKAVMDFTRYLTTQLAHQNLQRSTLRADLDLILFRIDLYRALAGDWPMEP